MKVSDSKEIYSPQESIVKVLPPQTGFLDAALKRLQATFHPPVDNVNYYDDDDDDDDDSPHRRSGIFPVLPWRDLTDFVRREVNPLASEEHLRELIQQLQLQGDVSTETVLIF